MKTDRRIAETVKRGSLAFGCAFALGLAGLVPFAYPGMPWLVLGPLAGVVAALACGRQWLAGVTAATGVLLGTAVASVFSAYAPFSFWQLPAYWWMTLAAFVSGALVVRVLHWREDLQRYFTYGGLALVLVGTCMAGWAYATHYYPDTRLTVLDYLDASPMMRAGATDEQVFIHVVRSMEQGTTYYQAMGTTLTELDQAQPGHIDDTSRFTSYRLPTLFWFLSVLPRGGVSWVVAILLLVSGALIAAWSIASRYVEPSVALVGTMVAGIYLADFADIYLPLTEVWAGTMGLIAVALALKSLSVRNRAMIWALGAASVALLASLTRELAVAFLLVGLCSTLVAKRTRSRRLWIPWTAGLGFFAAAMFAHASAVGAVARTLPVFRVPGSEFGQYLDPIGAGLPAAARTLGNLTWWSPALAWTVIGLGVAGGLVGSSDWPRRVLNGGVTLGGMIVLFFLHPPGGTGYTVPTTWSHVVLPTVLAFSPAAFWLVPWLRSPSAQEETQRRGSETRR